MNDRRRIDRTVARWIAGILACSLALAVAPRGNAALGTYLGSVALPSNAIYGLDVDPALDRVYASGGASGGQVVVAIDGTTGALTTIGTGSGTAVDTATSRYWSGGVYSGTAIARDGTTDATVISVPTGYCPIGADVDAVGRRVWVPAQCGPGNDPVHVIDADTFAVLATVFSGGVNGSGLVNPVTGRFYFTMSGGARRILPGPYALAGYAYGSVIAIDTVNGVLYSVTSSNALRVVDGTPEPEALITTVATSFSLPSSPGGAAVDPARGLLFVVNYLGGSLEVLDTSTNAFVDTIPLPAGYAPSLVDVDPTRSRAYVIARNVATNGYELLAFDYSAAPAVLGVTCPPDEVRECGPPGGGTLTLTFDVTQLPTESVTLAIDVDGIPAQTTTLPAGGPASVPVGFAHTYATGVHLVTAAATTPSGQSASCSTGVTILDTTPPSIACPPNVSAECTGPGGTVVTFPDPVALDACGAVTVVTLPASGSVFPVGTTTITSTATDAAGLTASCSFDVTVVDTTPPTIVCPADVTAECAGPGGTVVTFPDSVASDGCGDVTVSTVPASGSTFPTGTTTVTSTATDAAGNTASCSFLVHVVDTTPPVLSASLARTLLWLPLNGLVDAGLKVSATDVCDADVDVSVAVVSDESSASTAPSPDADLVGTAPARVLRLRAQRDAVYGNGRWYVVVVTAVDDAGNRTRAAFVSVVPYNLTTSQIAAVRALANAALPDVLATPLPAVPPGTFLLLGPTPLD